MQTDHYRIEAATSAHSAGNLTWGSWSHDVITAIGLSGAKNPLGFAVVRYLSETEHTSSDVWKMVLSLSGELIKRGKDKTKTSDLSARAITFWRDMRCSACQGRGVIDFEQNTCKECGGTGRRNYDGISSEVKEAVEILIEAEEWMEHQLRARLKGVHYTSVSLSDERVLRANKIDSVDLGNGGSMAIPIIY